MSRLDLATPCARRPISAFSALALLALATCTAPGGAARAIAGEGASILRGTAGDNLTVAPSAGELLTDCLPLRNLSSTSCGLAPEAHSAAVSWDLYNASQVCGACYLLTCDATRSECPPDAQVLVTLAHLCPATPPQGDPAQGCSQGQMLLSAPAYSKLAGMGAGAGAGPPASAIPVRAARTPCLRSGGLQFAVLEQSTRNYLALLVSNVAGPGALVRIEAKLSPAKAGEKGTSTHACGGRSGVPSGPESALPPVGHPQPRRPAAVGDTRGVDASGRTNCVQERLMAEEGAHPSSAPGDSAQGTKAGGLVAHPAPQWLPLTRVHGSVWALRSVENEGHSVSLRLVGQGGPEVDGVPAQQPVVVVQDAIPAAWKPGETYASAINFF